MPWARLPLAATLNSCHLKGFTLLPQKGPKHNVELGESHNFCKLIVADCLQQGRFSTPSYPLKLSLARNGVLVVL